MPKPAEDIGKSAQDLHQEGRLTRVLRRRCAYCDGPLVDVGHGYSVHGPLGYHLDCEACDVRWVVEMDERNPNSRDPNSGPFGDGTPLIFAGARWNQ